MWIVDRGYGTRCNSSSTDTDIPIPINQYWLGDYSKPIPILGDCSIRISAHTGHRRSLVATNSFDESIIYSNSTSKI